MKGWSNVVGISTPNSTGKNTLLMYKSRGTGVLTGTLNETGYVTIVFTTHGEASSSRLSSIPRWYKQERRYFGRYRVYVWRPGSYLLNLVSMAIGCYTRSWLEISNIRWLPKPQRTMVSYWIGCDWLWWMEVLQ